MTICIAGNSHVGALRRGLAASDMRASDIVFWGAPARWFRGVSYDGGKLIPPAEAAMVFKNVSGGRYVELPVGEFDALVLHGVYPLHVCTRLAALRNVTDDAELGRIVLATQAFSLAERMRGAAKRIIISATPLPREGTLTSATFPPDVAARVKLAARRLAGERSLTLIDQPPQTISADGLGTQRVFAHDAIHMLPSYGTLVLNALAAQFKT